MLYVIKCASKAEGYQQCLTAMFALAGYMDNVYRADDMVVICHIPEVPHLPNFSIKRKNIML